MSPLTVTQNMKRTERRAPIVRTDKISPVFREELGISETGLSESAAQYKW